MLFFGSRFLFEDLSKINYLCCKHFLFIEKISKIY